MATKSSKTTGRSKSGKRASTNPGSRDIRRRTTARSKRKSTTTTRTTAPVAQAALQPARTTYDTANDCSGADVLAAGAQYIDTLVD